MKKLIIFYVSAILTLVSCSLYSQEKNLSGVITYTCEKLTILPNEDLKIALAKIVENNKNISFYPNEMPCASLKNLTEIFNETFAKRYFDSIVSYEHAALINQDKGYFSIERFDFADNESLAVVLKMLATRNSKRLQSPSVLHYEYFSVSNSLVFMIYAGSAQKHADNIQLFNIIEKYLKKENSRSE